MIKCRNHSCLFFMSIWIIFPTFMRQGNKIIKKLSKIYVIFYKFLWNSNINHNNAFSPYEI